MAATQRGVVSMPSRARPVIIAGRKMQELFAFASRVAAGDAKVLITGESGAGKDVLARHIHAHSLRAGGEFVAVNCAGLAESLLESELFGHLKGSFTGAYRDKRGKVQLADGGTLFLDEVAEMSPRMQGLLLRFLESGEIQPVGSDTVSARVDVRVIAATNRDLAQMVAAGAFREDLLYRLRVIHLHVPPLRERREDIEPLARHFLARTGRQVTLTEEAWQALERYHWPGNVRELQNVIEQIAWAAGPEAPVRASQLPPAVTRSGAGPAPAIERRRQVADELYDAVVEHGYSFWEHVHPLFLNRDITRHDLREMLRRGLSVTRGSYRGLLQLFRIPPSDYKRFMNFLAAHDCGVDFREFRRSTGEHERRRRQPLFPELSALDSPSGARLAGTWGSRKAVS